MKDQYIPAHPGFFVIGVLNEEDNSLTIWREPVIAWHFDEEGNGPTPTTLEGPELFSSWAVLSPGGTVTENNNCSYTYDEWLAKETGGNRRNGESS